MLKIEKCKTQIEKEIKEKLLKKNDWILFTINYLGNCPTAPPAILARFVSLDPLDHTSESLRGFTVTDALRVYLPYKISDNLFIPRVKRVNEDLGSNENPPVKYTLDLPKKIYIGKEEIIRGFKEIKGLEYYSTWFEQFLFK